MLDGYVKIRFMEFRMKDFFSRYSYRIVKMFVTQAAIGLFGAVLAFAVTGGGDTALALTGVFAVLFYIWNKRRLGGCNARSYDSRSSGPCTVIV